MSTPVLKVKVIPKTIIRGRMDVRFPASVSAESPILLDKTGGTFAFSFDMNAVIQSVTFAGFVSGPASAVDGNIPQFDGTTGKKLKDGKAAPTGDIVGTTDTQTLTNKTLTAPAISSPTGLVKADVGLGNVDNTSDATKNAATVTLTNKTINAPDNTITNLATSMFAANVVDNDGTLAANSSTRIPTQAAVKAYADQVVAATDAMVFKGVIDCSTNPNYPAADRGWTYKVSVAGKIGGASGVTVEAGDTLMCLTDGTAAGNQATVGASWNIVQANLVGAVTGPASSTSGNIATFNGTGGTVIQDGGKALPSGAIVGTSDSQTLTTKTIDTASNTFKLNGVAFGTASQATAALDAVVGDSGSGGTKGLVPAPAAGDASGGKYLKADGTWAVPAGGGTGDVAGDTHAATSKTTPVDADELPLVDSAASNVLKKLTWANLKAAVFAWLISQGYLRKTLTADLNLYVNSGTGNDSNDGSSGSPFLTTQKAINYAASLDLSIYKITINVTGNFTETPALKSYIGAGPIIIVGDETTPANCTYTGAGSQSAIFLADSVLGRWDIRGVKITSSVSGQHGINATNNSVVGFQNIECGSLAGSAGQIASTDGGIVVATGNYKISGGASYHAGAIHGGLMRMAFRSITITNTPAFSTAFLNCSDLSSIRAQSMTFTGSATGVRYISELASAIVVGGAGASYLPGNSNGTPVTGGQYA